MLDPVKVELTLGPKGPQVFYRRKQLVVPHVVIPRVAHSIASYGLPVVDQLQLLGAKVMNGARAIGRARNSMRCLQLLTAHGIAVPKTVMAREAADLKAMVSLVGGVPVLVKLLAGHEKRGVMVCETLGSLEAALEAVLGLGHNLVLQEYVRAKTHDVRVFVVGGKALASVRRKATPGRLSRTLSKAAQLEACELTDAYRTAAEGASKLCELEVCAVDLLDVVQRHGCSTAVVDVSAETAVLCRLAGLRVITLRQSGRRDDAAHRLAHDSADVVWVPQVETLEPGVDAIDRRFCSGAFSRWDGRDDDRDAARRRLGLASGRDVVLVVVGGGGTTFPEDAWRRAGSRPDVEVIVIGLPQRWSTGSVTSWGRVRDPFDFFCAADVVISAAGWATVHDAASLGRPSAVVAEDRPFDEQAVRAAALTAAGLVVTLEHWPEPGDLDAVVRSARSLDPTLWAPHYDGRGAERAAAMIDGVHLGR